MTPSTASVNDIVEPDASLRCRPFVKWVGGKGQLLDQLLTRVPQRFNRYYEPFVGGGALFFALQPLAAKLSDSNEDLICCYSVVRDQVEELITDLGRHRYEESYYYSIRGLDRTADYQKLSPLERASRLIFLNKTCYNGLYRVNARGQFNTPFGRYSNPRIVDAENLRACSLCLQGVELRVSQFWEFESEIGADDFVYLDPPYVPLSASASFTGYQQGGFNSDMQRALAQLCERLDKRGIRFMLSNSSAPLVTELYGQFKIEKVAANRAINSVAGKRGSVEELVVTNY